MYAEAKRLGSSTSRLRSTTTASGRAKAVRTAWTAWLGRSLPTRTPATRTPAGIVLGRAGGVFVVVVVLVVVVAVVVAVVTGAVVVTAVVVVEVDVVITSAITAPENAPAATSPSAKSQRACRCFTAQAV